MRVADNTSIRNHQALSLNGGMLTDLYAFDCRQIVPSPTVSHHGADTVKIRSPSVAQRACNFAPCTLGVPGEKVAYPRYSSANLALLCWDNPSVPLSITSTRNHVQPGYIDSVRCHRGHHISSGRSRRRNRFLTNPAAKRPITVPSVLYRKEGHNRLNKIIPLLPQRDNRLPSPTPRLFHNKLDILLVRLRMRDRILAIH